MNIVQQINKNKIKQWKRATDIRVNKLKPKRITPDGYHIVDKSLSQQTKFFNEEFLFVQEKCHAAAKSIMCFWSNGVDSNYLQIEITQISGWEIVEDFDIIRVRYSGGVPWIEFVARHCTRVFCKHHNYYYHDGHRINRTIDKTGNKPIKNVDLTKAIKQLLLNINAVDDFDRIKHGVRIQCRCSTNLRRKSTADYRNVSIFKYVTLGSKLAKQGDAVDIYSNRWRIYCDQKGPIPIEELNPTLISEWLIDKINCKIGRRNETCKYNNHHFLDIFITVPDYKKAKTYKYKVRLVQNKEMIKQPVYKITY